MRHEESSYKNKVPPSKKELPPSKKEMFPIMNNKFGYNFQPATIPSYNLPGSKNANRNLGIGLGGISNLPMPKQLPKGKGDLFGAGHYKF